MRKLAIAAIAFMSLASTAQAQQLTVEETLSIQNRASTGDFAARAEWNALTYYLQGLIEGAAGYQQTLMKQGKKPLFCPPSGKSHSIEHVIRYLTNSAKKDKLRPASLVIIESYASAYPCGR